MSKIGSKWLSKEPRDDVAILHRHPASAEAAAKVITADETSDDGRSEWLWIRLHNGDLILGCYPQGHTYESVEEDAVYVEVVETGLDGRT